MNTNEVIKLKRHIDDIKQWTEDVKRYDEFHRIFEEGGLMSKEKKPSDEIMEFYRKIMADKNAKMHDPCTVAVMLYLDAEQEKKATP